MKKFCLIFLPLFLYMIASCGKIELQESELPDSGNGENPESPNPADTSTVVPLKVVELASVEDGTEVQLVGYIVGFVPKSSISKTVFGVAGAVETNVVVADSPMENDYKKCAAVQLEADSYPREDLNLVSHPENLGAYVHLIGLKKRYYYAPGLKPVYMAEFIDPGQGGKPDDSGKNPRTYPILSKEPPRVIQGH